MMIRRPIWEFDSAVRGPIGPFWRFAVRIAYGVFLICGLNGPIWADEANPTRPSLVEIQVVTGSGEPKIRLFSSDPIDLTAALTENPDQLVLSVPPLKDRLIDKKKTFEAGPFLSYESQISELTEGKIRFLFRELLAPVQITREAVANGAAYTATVQLRKVDKREFQRLAKLAGDDKKPNSGRMTGAADPQNRPLQNHPLIVIDPGHGGQDTGAAGLGGVLEKDIVFAFSKALQRSLEATGQVRARLTRETDIFIPLDKRVEIARKMGADYFISIHADTLSSSTDVHGMTVYVGSDRASDAEAARLAESENRADLAGGLVATKTEDVVAGILGDLMVRETRERTLGLAHSVIERMTEAWALNKNPIRSAAFRVLRAPDFPSVLIELGYMSSPSDIGLLTSDVWTGKAADSLSAALVEFLSAQKQPSAALAGPE